MGLRWSMVKLERGRLVLPDSKTGEKTVPLSPQAVALLRELDERREDAGGDALVCPGERGGPLHNLGRAWDSIRKRAGLDEVRLHDLRHAAASDAAVAGLSLPMIGKMLGHRNPKTTQRYAHLAERAGQDAAERMGAQIERNTREGIERLRQQRSVGDDQGEAGGEVVPIGGAKVIRFPGLRRD